MKDTELYDRYERTLEDGLVKICRGAGLVGDMLLRSDDIDARWDDYIKDYVADAVENFNIYPEAAISWAGFLGIAVAHWWDADWQGHKDDPYRSFYGTRGWDDMDEHVLRDLLGLKLDSPEAKKISDTLLSCALATLGLIRHEGIETQTEQRRNRTPAPRLQSGSDPNQEIAAITAPASQKAGYQALCKENWLFSRSARLSR